MIFRNSLKTLTRTVTYGMSKKKITQQWRKPVEQLKKQQQQNAPISKHNDENKKRAREWLQGQARKTQAPKNTWKTKQTRRPQKPLQSNQSGSTKPSSSQPLVVNTRNWLQIQQFSQTSKQLSDTITQALRLFKNKYVPELKQLLVQAKAKYHAEGYEIVLNVLFKQDFFRMLDELKLFNIQITHLTPKTINNILFTLAKEQQLSRLQNLLTELENNKIELICKHDQFFELLFLKEISQQIKFLYGQNSVNVNSQNKQFTKKLQISLQYLKVLSETDTKKRNLKRKIIPIWFDKISKIVLKYRFALNQYRDFITQILLNNHFLIPQNFSQTDQFSILLKTLYFGHQQYLSLILDIVEKNFTKVKFSSFFRQFTNQLMIYRIQNEKSAFTVDQILINYYKKAFDQKNKYLAIVCTVIASDAKYKDLAQHYCKFYMQGFPNESLASQDTKFVQQGIINNYDQNQDVERHQKNLNRIIKLGQNAFTRIKAAIKLGDNTAVYKICKQQIFKKIAITRQRKNIQFVLRSKLIQRSNTSYFNVSQLNTFLQQLSDEYLWSLHERSQDLTLALQKYLPEGEEKFSFWQQRLNQQRFEQISKKVATGQLKRIKQPASDIQSSNFNLDQYLETQYPHLHQLQLQQYESQKQLIKYTLRLEGLQFLNKVQNDHVLMQKLKQFQDQLSEQNLAVVESFGLKDYNITQYGWKDFDKRFQNMKMYKNVVRDYRLDWDEFQYFIQKNKILNKKHLIEDMMIKMPEIFTEAQALVKLDQQPIVNRLLLWGVYTNEPMAIYLGQKIAMQTGQIIPHEIAQKVSRMLSYKRTLSDEFINKCKQCLRVVGKIDRQFIYSFDKQYQHILVRKDFFNYVKSQIQQKKLDNSDLEDLIRYNPRPQVWQKETRLYHDSITHRAQCVL